MGNIVAIVGRPNVGKSTLFNRLVGERKAIVDDFSGVTRDRHYGTAEWVNKKFIVIDTGGYVTHSEDVFEKAIRRQVEIAIEEAEVLLFMVDVSTGITDLDQSFVQVLRRSKKPVIVVVNKVDNNERLMDAVEFYNFGFEKIFSISSVSGSGTGELLDEVTSLLYTNTPAEEQPEQVDAEYTDEDEDDENENEEPRPLAIPKIAVVGRPNVGKSSFINALLGEDRNIVTEVAGTTRDTLHTLYKAYGKEYLLVDTAGIRRKTKVKEDIEFYSVMRSLRALEDCDICVVMIDATLGMESQDLNLLYLALRNNKGIVVLVNKWDLVENKENNTAKEFEDAIKEKTAPFVDFPVVFMSVHTKQRIFKATETIAMVHENLTKRISTSKLNEYLLPLIENYPPPSLKGKYIRIKYVTQLKAKSVAFAFFCNLPQYVKEPYKRFLENRIRQEYNFEGVPVNIFFRKK